MHLHLFKCVRHQRSPGNDANEYKTTFLPELSENILHIWILLLQVQIQRAGLWEGLEDVCNHQHPGL